MLGWAHHYYCCAVILEMYIPQNYHLQDITAAPKCVIFSVFLNYFLQAECTNEESSHAWDRDFSSVVKTSLTFARLHMESGKWQGTQFIPLWPFHIPVAQRHTYLHLSEALFHHFLGFSGKERKEKIIWLSKYREIKQNPQFFFLSSIEQKNVDINKLTLQFCENTSYVDFSLHYPLRAARLQTSNLQEGGRGSSLLKCF